MLTEFRIEIGAPADDGCKLSMFGSSRCTMNGLMTTIDRAGQVNVAPMGVEWGEDVIVLKPFLETTTYRNVVASRTAVVNLIDDVRVFARAAISSPAYETEPAVVVPGIVLADCCSWRELEAMEIDSTPPWTSTR